MNGQQPAQPNPPSWQSTVIAVVLMAIVGGVFIIVYLKSGIDTAIKAWAGLGTLVGVLTGAIPTYFFGQAAIQRANATADAAHRNLQDRDASLQLARADLQADLQVQKDRADHAEAGLRS